MPALVLTRSPRIPLVAGPAETRRAGARAAGVLVAVAAVWAADAGPLGAGPLLAQTAAAPVTGLVRDSVTRAPLPGAVVQLRDSLDRTVGQGVTDERGRYRLPSSAAARRLRVLRLGFRPAEAPLTALGPTRDVLLAPVPALLAPVRVTAAARCPARTNSAAALGLLEQVRAGLLATVIARAEQPSALTLLAYEREYASPEHGRDVGRDPPGDAGARQAVRRLVATSAPAAFGASRSGAAFVADGFHQDSAGRSRFFAPDADTLVDDDFVAGYCFRVVAPDAARPHEVGLGFAAPRRRAGRVDVDGVLWVDTVARTLRELTFRYVGLDRHVDAFRPGGRLTLAPMPTGVAFIDRWALRLMSGPPAVAAAALGRPRLAAHEIGGVLAQVAWPGGRLWRAPLGTLRLRVADTRGRPVGGAVVRLEGTDLAGTADTAGVLTLGPLLPGPYTATVADPRLVEFDLARTTQLHVGVGRDTAEARHEVEAPEELVAARCARDGSAARAARDTAQLLGRVVLADGRAVDGAWWRVADLTGAVLVPARRAGSDGLFQWCALPPGVPVRVDAGAGALRASATPLLRTPLTTVWLTLGPSGGPEPVTEPGAAAPMPNGSPAPASGRPYQSSASRNWQRKPGTTSRPSR